MSDKQAYQNLVHYFLISFSSFCIHTEIVLLSQVTIEATLNNLSLNGDHPDQDQEPEEAQMWTRKEINEFKDSIRKEESDSIIKIGHGETVTVRVPTHVDGKSLYWEFATDSYDIGFGLFFEWVEPEDTQVIEQINFEGLIQGLQKCFEIACC